MSAGLSIHTQSPARGKEEGKKDNNGGQGPLSQTSESAFRGIVLDDAIMIEKA